MFAGEGRFEGGDIFTVDEVDIDFHEDIRIDMATGLVFGSDGKLRGDLIDLYFAIKDYPSKAEAARALAGLLDYWDFKQAAWEAEEAKLVEADVNFTPDGFVDEGFTELQNISDAAWAVFAPWASNAGDAMPFKFLAEDASATIVALNAALVGVDRAALVDAFAGGWGLGLRRKSVTGSDLAQNLGRLRVRHRDYRFVE